MSLAVFGAGAIGRGLLGELAAQAGWPVVFIEKQPEFARQLAAAGQYTVRLVGRGESVTRVTNYRVLTASDTATIAATVRDCELAATAVGGEQLGVVAGLLAPALRERAKALPVLVCENWSRADAVLTEALTRAGAAPDAFFCVPVSVERMVQRTAGLDLVGENGETGWAAATVPLPGLNGCADLTPYYARKLYTNNAGHALLAYEGFWAGHATLCAALAEPAIRRRLEALLAVAAGMLEREYGIAADALREHVDCLVRYRFANTALADRVERVARQPLRKLGPQERLVGLLRCAEKHGLPARPVCRAIAAALHYDDPRDAESRQLQAWVRADGPGRVLQEVCGLHPEEENHRLCLAEWTAMNRPKEKP